ncbi:MAG TPA: hypothetical protein VHD89_11250 [Rhodanobacteraceae bacterium]|nr:hypothetical protein [Rhodanobacteraceae bacterium]
MPVIAQRAHDSNAVRAAPGPSNIKACCTGWLHAPASKFVTTVPAFWLIASRCAGEIVAMDATSGSSAIVAKAQRTTIFWSAGVVAWIRHCDSLSA